MSDGRAGLVGRTFRHFAQSLPERVPRLLEKGRNKVAFDLLRLLADRLRRPAELRAAVGIKSRIHFNRYYLAPMLEKGPCRPNRPRAPELAASGI